MSIKMENTATPLEKADALANYVEQMYLANATHDQQHFRIVYAKASKLAFDLCRALEKMENK